MLYVPSPCVEIGTPVSSGGWVGGVGGAGAVAAGATALVPQWMQNGVLTGFPQLEQ
jgi:hypothetical protein